MRICSLTFLLFITFSVFAQRTKFKVEGVAPNLFLIYKVKSGETVESIATSFNQKVQAIKFINNLKNSDLQVGSEIQIPLDKNNFEQDGQMLPDETLIPLYHKVTNGESLYRIGLNHNKVPVTSIKEWNNLNKDAIWVGMQLIVGHLKIKNNQVAIIYGEKQDENSVSNNKLVEENKVETSPIVEKPIIKKQPEFKYAFTNNGFSAGFFAKDFPSKFKDRDAQNLNGDAASFKSISGWNDYKFYVLINNVTPGTIVKITGNNKFVYAKVLGALPEIKENNGLLLRLSNATSSMLGLTNNKFSINVEYYN